MLTADQLVTIRDIHNHDDRTKTAQNPTLGVIHTHRGQLLQTVAELAHDCALLSHERDRWSKPCTNCHGNGIVTGPDGGPADCDTCDQGRMPADRVIDMVLAPVGKIVDRMRVEINAQFAEEAEKIAAVSWPASAGAHGVHCGATIHGHGPICADDCPTCGKYNR